MYNQLTNFLCFKKMSTCEIWVCRRVKCAKPISTIYCSYYKRRSSHLQSKLSNMYVALPGLTGAYRTVISSLFFSCKLLKYQEASSIEPLNKGSKCDTSCFSSPRYRSTSFAALPIYLWYVVVVSSLDRMKPHPSNFWIRLQNVISRVFFSSLQLWFLWIAAFGRGLYHVFK